jgi:RNA recognition motif-containing protein
MAALLYVGNLARETTENALREVLERDGRSVKSLVIKVDKDTGRSRGFAFAELGSAEDVESAIASLSGKELDGRPLKVNHGHDRPTYTGQSRSDDSGDFRGGFRRSGGGRGRR